ncbi:hypothetical protein KP003_14180 [Geomonas nitrogeniifigens]|uniref:hypothetical protein n=1 Tax=Geomonas diazotrophica TaxID=2843197 RepID=UPI001C2BAE4B|nr:hypothetical protein [Geomonas nitrogeniifigens]QXE85524.1 hypothetical protein KP003_14180 [Geomonas nitrogeniifigens]
MKRTGEDIVMTTRSARCFFFYLLGFLLVLPGCSKSGSKYQCKTDDSGLIPIKIIISKFPHAFVSSDATSNSGTGSTVDFYKPYYVFDIKESFYKIGSNPFDKGSVVGWVRKNDALMWSTNQAIQFAAKSPSVNQYFWVNKNEINSPRPNFMLKGDSRDYQYPFPIIASEGSKFQVALDYRNMDGTDKGAAIGWTQELRMGDDAYGLCSISKAEFAARIEALQNSVQNLKQDKSDDPVREILENVLKLNIGSGTDTENKSFNVLQLIGKLAPIPVAQQNPADIRRNQERYQRKIAVMREYLQNSSNWDQYGFGTIPIELVN